MLLGSALEAHAEIRLMLARTSKRHKLELEIAGHLGNVETVLLNADRLADGGSHGNPYRQLTKYTGLGLDMNQLLARTPIVKRAGDIEFWRSICPQLSISDNVLCSHMKPYAVASRDVQLVGQQILEEGYFQVS